MEKRTALQVFEALSSGIRLDIYRCLVVAGRQGMVAGEIAAALDIPPTNLSFHLKNLTQSGLLWVEQEGRFQRYRANIEAMLAVIAYLTENCCAGRPQECVDFRRSQPGLAPLLPPLDCPAEGPGHS